MPCARDEIKREIYKSTIFELKKDLCVTIANEIHPQCNERQKTMLISVISGYDKSLAKNHFAATPPYKNKKTF